MSDYARKPSKGQMEAMLDDAISQRNELQALLCACVTKSGGEITLSNALVRASMDGETQLTVTPDSGGIRIVTERTGDVQ